MGFLNKISAAFLAYPDKPAFCVNGHFYTYRQLSLRASAIYNELNTRYSAEQQIGILINDDLETYASIIAILFCGKTYVPINPQHPAQRIKQIIEQADINLLLSGTLDQYEDGPVLNVSALELPKENLLSCDKYASATYAYTLFTSGSTGIPKGVPITYHNLNSFVSAFFELGYELDEQDKFLQMFDLTFDLSVMSYLIPLCIGACVYTVPDKGVKFTNVYNILETYDITFALMVPSILMHLRQYFNEISLPALRYCLFCGEALITDVLREWMNCIPGAVVENVYGPTEATIFCLVYNIDREVEITSWNGITAIGVPMKGMEAIVVNDALELLPDGEQGELCLYGEQLTPGYLTTEKNKEVFFTHAGKKYYKTGDVSYKNEADIFVYCGRTDNQVKVQGFRIELSEIEFHLRQLTGLSNIACFAITGANGITQIEAVFECEEKNMTEITDALKTKLPVYMIPAATHFVATFPLNTNGKTDRKELKKLINS